MSDQDEAAALEEAIRIIYDVTEADTVRAMMNAFPQMAPNAVSEVFRVMAALRQAREEATREALGRACKAICGPCADGWEVQCGRAVPPDLWYHPTQADRGAQVCHAGPIRALIPAPSPAPSGKVD